MASFDIGNRTLTTTPYGGGHTVRIKGGAILGNVAIIKRGYRASPATDAIGAFSSYPRRDSLWEAARDLLIIHTMKGGTPGVPWLASEVALALGLAKGEEGDLTSGQENVEIIRQSMVTLAAAGLLRELGYQGHMGYRFELVGGAK